VRCGFAANTNRGCFGCAAKTKERLCDHAIVSQHLQLEVLDSVQIDRLARVCIAMLKD